MHIQKLSIQNFMSIGEASLALDERGLVLIQGKNEDDSSALSNGAGKSSIPDAISWCLFGETARGESGDAIVNRKAGKNTQVEISLRDGDTIYSIVRYRKHSKEKNRLTVSTDTADLTLGTDKLTQELVEKIIGCKRDVFNSAIYAGQERMPDLPSMTDKQLKDLIEEAAGLTQIQDFLEYARAGRIKVSETVTAHKSKAEVAKTVVSNLEMSSAEYAERVDQWLIEQQDTLKRYEEQAKSASDVSIPDLQGKIAERTARIVGIKKTVESIKGEIATVETRRKADGAVLTKAEKQVTAASTRLKVVGEEIKREKAKLEELDSQVGTPCGECGKLYQKDDLETARKARRAGLTERVRVYKGLQEELDKARTALEDAKRAVESHPSTADLADKISGHSKEIVEHSEQISHLEKLVREIQSILDNIEALKKAVCPFVELRDETAARLVEAVAAHESAVKALEDSQKELTLWDQAVEVFGPAGVRAHILDNVTPYLNTRTAQYLSVLSDGNLSAMWSTLSATAKGDLREKFVIEVKHAKGGDSFGLLSGGEKRKVRLSCALALQDLVATRAYKPFRLFIADEIDDALDSAGLERLMTILDEKARDRGTVLVISHNELSDWIREVVTVVKRDGSSTVEGAICED